MRRSMLLVLIAGLVLAAYCPSPASAQLECTDPDLIALVFENGDINITSVGTPYTAEVRLLNPSAATGFNAFEFNLIVPSNTFLLGTQLPPDSVNVGDPPSEFIVGIAGCETTVDNQLVLVTLTLLTVDTTQGDFFIQLTQRPSIPGNLAYQDCSGPPLLPMYPISQDFLLPVARAPGLLRSPASFGHDRRHRFSR